MRKKEEYFENIKIKSNFNKKTKENKEFKDINFKKNLGQNFISDNGLLDCIIDISEISNSDLVLEIGAGAGTLTDKLAQNSKQVLSYEIDKSLKPRLDKILEKHDNLHIEYKDFMEVDEKEIFKGQKFKVVANIPYYITSPIIFKLMNVGDRIESMLFMVQKEVAERFSSNEGNKEYGIPSIMLQAVSNVSLEKVVPKEWFTPAPKVDSALMKILPQKDRFIIEDFGYFSSLVHSAFGMRRKTLVNNLTNNFYKNKEKLINIIKKLNYNENVRPEEISVENYIKLAKILKNN